MAGKRHSGPGRRPAAAATDLPLSLERIAATAVELLDTDGVDGLNMRRLAERLGAGAMSLYWHVGNKDGLFDLALDRVLAYQPPADVPADWRDAIIHMLQDWRAAMLRHPWSASLLPRRALGPSMLARLELLSATLARAGVVDADLNVAVWSMWNYVMGVAVTRSSFDRSTEDRAAAQLSLTEAHYPTIARSGLLLDNDWDGVFLSGLTRLLDGVAPRR